MQAYIDSKLRAMELLHTHGSEEQFFWIGEGGPGGGRSENPIFLDGLDHCHVFELSGMMGRVFLLTDNSVRKGVRLPFKQTFVDVIIEYGNHRIYGMLLSEIVDIGGGSYKIAPQDTDQMDDIHIQTIIEGPDGYGLMVLNLYRREKEGLPYKGVSPDGRLNEYLNLNVRQADKLREVMRQMVMNFHDFMADPDIKLVRHKRSEESNEKRIRRGKMPLPSSTIVKVTGKMKTYIDGIEEKGRNMPYSHRFWVRGHWRHLRSPKWKNKQGERIWIPPFVKGDGILVDKRHQIGKVSAKPSGGIKRH